MKIQIIGVLIGLLVAVAPAPAADVVLETNSLRLEIGGDGIVKSLTSKPGGTEYVWPANPAPVAMVYRGGQPSAMRQEDFAENEAPDYRGGESFGATKAVLEGDKLTVRFGKANVTATYRVTATRHYLALELLKLEGDPIDRIDLLQFNIRRLPYLGPWINVACDDRFSICLCAGNIKTNAGMNRHEKYVRMRAVADRAVAFEGTTAVLFGCHDPKDKFLDAMEIVERDFNMPSGARNRRSPIQKYSYLWCSPTPSDVDEYIKLAKRSGLRMIFFSYTSITNGAGHFTFNSKFPGGMDDLKKVTGAIRRAGLKLGLHIHYSKAVKNDPYVTPVPDDRFHKVRTFTLAEPIDDKSVTIPVKENPAGCTLDKGRRILKAGKELIAYKGYTTEPPLRFTGCERGHLKTTASAHRAGDRLGLLNVDDWDIFIRFDQDTDIQDEVARRIGKIYRQSGPYDMVYFDGAEDVHAPFWYHVVGAQYRVFRQLQPEPPVCEAAMSCHFSWHMMTRSNAYDVPSRYIKSFTHKVSCRTAPVRARDFTRMDFGWIFGLYDYIGPDALEYLLSRAAAWDCPFSIRISPKQVEANPRAEDCLDVIKIWEDARIENKLTDTQRQTLKTVDPKHYEFIKTWNAMLKPERVNTWKKAKFSDQEHHLFINETGQYELVAIDEIPGVADGKLLRAYSFRRAAKPNDTYVLVWAVRGNVKLLLPVASNRLTVMKPLGTRRPVEAQGDKAAVTVGDRTYLVLADTNPDRARDILHKAVASKTAE